MTLLTDIGVTAATALILDNLSDIAVGTGTVEDSSATTLDNRVHRASRASQNVQLKELSTEPQNTEYELTIRVTGGIEVSEGTAISEVGAFIARPDGTVQLTFVDSFAPVTVDAGQTEEFVIPVSAANI
jgi:ATP-dependent protease ClpP protease subunit